MAARVQQLLEDMVPELRKLSELQVFTETEVRDMAERRRKYEYAVISTDPVFSRNSFREYISYEVELDRLLQRRLRKAKANNDRTDVRYTVESDHGNVPLQVTVRRRIHRIFKRCLKRFVTDVELWKDYCAFCYRIKALNVMNRAIMDALAKNPTCEPLWKIATKYTLTLKGSIAARKVVQMALRANPRSLSLFMLLLELEVQITHKLFLHSATDESETPENVDPADISARAWGIIMRHALNTLKGGDVFKMLLFGATICARVRRATGFAKVLHDYGEFASLVYDEMFNRRLSYPLLGLYVWQHRFLESLLMQHYGGSDVSSTPDSVFSAIVNDCVSNPSMMPVVCQFIKVVATSDGSPSGAAGDAATSHEGVLWMTDIEGLDVDIAKGNGEGSTGNESTVSRDMECTEMDAYCEGIDVMKDICFLRAASDNFDERSRQCEYVKGMLDNRQLTALNATYYKFFFSKMKAAATAVSSIINKLDEQEVGSVLLASSDPLVNLVARQIVHPDARSCCAGGYSLSIEFSRHLDSEAQKPFIGTLKRSFLNLLSKPDVKELTKSSLLLMLMEWDQVDAVSKLEASRTTSVNLTRQQLLSAVEAAVNSVEDDMLIIGLVLSLMATSASALVEDFASGGDAVSRVFSIVAKRVRDPTECIRQHRTNRLGLPNFGLLSVVISFWQVECTMAKLTAEFKQNECSEFLNNYCDDVSVVYAKAARELIELCETAVAASETVNIAEAALKKTFRSRCWQRYLSCAKGLEQMDLMVPIFNLHSFNFSSDAVAARAFAQLGPGFVTKVM
ncbi:U3 small nucleolar RNA-associated protein 6 [Babesia caballi]|uniref:U3 small nucleolar RNA-associated protein 6 n=1 Tax=Babesia caballi TaxID=5871 RepID=A0AAV4LSS6_BABCB|nr:U3 small nucleolar RNA-associated protein 6 [Babesia caballi]